jgi:outer membrane protein assembly factor BamB
LALTACSSGTTTVPAGGPAASSSNTNSSPPAVDVVTYKYDSARTGQNRNETVLTVDKVNVTKFGLKLALTVDGVVDAQPLYLSKVSIAGSSHNVVYVATEHDSVYAIDADSGATLWQVSLLKTGEITSVVPGCAAVTPEMGITATPVIDRSAGTNGAIYVVAQSIAAGYIQRLHALDLTTGEELFNGPTDIVASYTNAAGTTTFDPFRQLERPALLLVNGQILTSWASHCDVPPYGGWIIAYNQSDLTQTAAINVAPSSGIPFVGGNASNVYGPAIWMSGAGPAADADGNVFMLTGNGQFEATPDLSGFPSLGDYGNSFLKLANTATSLKIADYFTMSDEVTESFNDQDLGSGGVMLLPDQTDAKGTTRQLAIGAGKDGTIYVVERGSMGRFNADTNNNWQAIAGQLGPVYGSPAYFNRTIYYGGHSGFLQQFYINDAKLSTSPVSSSPTAYISGTSPIVSANGNADAIVWAVDGSSSPSVLHAYDARRISIELYNSSQAPGARDAFTATRFPMPMEADGKVFVGGPGTLSIFGLLN